MQLHDRMNISRWKQFMACVMVGMFLLAGLPAWSTQTNEENGVLRSRVYNLNHITSTQAQEYFSQLNIGKGYNPLTPEMLILTSNIGSDLVKATEIIGMFDREQPAHIQVLAVAIDGGSLPDPAELMIDAKTATVGTMLDAPSRDAPNPAIIDRVGDTLVAIAAEDLMPEIIIAYETWKDKHAPAPAPAEETAAEPTPEPAEPNLIITPESVPAADEPEAAPAEDAQPEEAEEQQLQEEPPHPTLEEIVKEVWNGEAAPEAEQPDDALEPEATPEDFMGTELLRELSDAEEQAQREQAAEAAATVKEQPAEAAVAVKEQPAETDAAIETPEQSVEPDPMEIMRALLEQAKADEAAHTSIPDDTEAPAVQPDAEADPIQAELQMLREKLAQLEARAAGIEEPEPAVEPESPKDEPTPAESKIQKTGTVQTQPQIDLDLSEEELNTVVDLPQEVELESLVDLVGKQLGLNYYYDPAILKNQKVKLMLHGGKIKVWEMYALLESVLRQKGFVMTRRDQLVTIIKTADANQALKQGDIEIREPDDPIPPGTLIVKTKFTLEHIDPASAMNMLKKLQLGMTNGFQELPEANALIVIDYSYRMDQIQKVLEMVDIPGEKKEYKFRTLEHIKPSEIVPKLEELAKQLEGVSLQISASKPAAAPRTRTVRTRDPKTGKTVTKQVPIPAPSKPGTAAKQPAGQDTVYIDTDDRTNRILIAGKRDQIELVNELIDALDVPQHDLRYVREYIIQNIEADEIVNVMNELGVADISISAPTRSTGRTTPTPAGTRTPARATPSPAPKSAAAAGSEEPYISIRSATNSLLVNATAEQHKAIELVIAHIDVVQKDQRTIRQYEIQYVDTQEIIDTLVDLEIIAPDSARMGTSSQSRSSTSRSTRQPTGRPGQPQPAEGAAVVSLPTAGGGSEKELMADQPQISVLETTNSLLVYATPRQHDAIALVIGHADRQLDTITTPYVVYNLENQNALDLAGTLNELIQETFDQVEKKSTPQSKIQRSGTAATTPSNIPALQEERPKVIGDEKSNSIIVYGNKRAQQWISELVKELDQNRFQVLLDVTLVEISKTDEFNYDLDLISAVPNMDTLSGALDYTIGRSNVSDILENLAAAEDRSRFKEATSRGGRFEGFYGNDHIMALLDLMESKGYGRVLNRPRILVNDNEPGSITLETVTYREIRTTTIVGSDNPQTSENVDYRDYSAGITLSITPHISQEDRLRLEISLNRSDFVDTGAGEENRPPDTINSDVDTVVTVPDESTVILGGLERINQGKGGSKVPILGDIPLIGGLFRTIDNSDEQRKIYIFVKANILRPGEDNQDLKDISDKNIEVFEYYEREMQGYQDWPGVDPKPIDPKRILREEDDILEALDKQDPAIKKWSQPKM